MNTDGKVRIVWNGRVVNGRETVLGCVDTTIPSILTVLESMGKCPDEFNSMVTGARANPQLPVPCVYGLKVPALERFYIN